MKFIRFLLLAAIGLLLPACAAITVPVGNSVPVPEGTVPQAAKFNLFAGADLDQAQVVYPGGPSIGIAGLKTSPGMQMVTSAVGDGLRWWGLGKLATGYFKDKSISTTQAGMTSRAKIGADAGVRTAEINAFKPMEALPLATP